MFIRFVSGEIDESSHLAAGLFCAADELLWSDDLPDYELDVLKELTDWFNVHLASPFDYLRDDVYYDRSVCWFKSTAREHIAKAWELVWILERNDVLIWTIRSGYVGFVHYEDDVQVFARPSRDLRRKL